MLALLLALSAGLAFAQPVTVSEPWARATVRGQKATGVFMRLTSDAGSRLVSVSTPVAAFGEVHEMRIDGDVMKMRALKDGLEVPAGKSVELKPGGFHIMLMDLNMPLQKDSTIPLTLVFVNAQGVQSRIELNVPVSSMAPMSHTGQSEPVAK